MPKTTRARAAAEGQGATEDETTSGWRHTHVVKTLWPGSAGTKKLSQAHTDLVCVRYRHNAHGTVRYTTVELVVEHCRVKIRPLDHATYGVKIWWGEIDLSRRAKAAGGNWNEHTQLWMMTGRAVKLLRLQNRIRQK